MRKVFYPKLLNFIVIGIVFHVIYLYSIIDIYFQSPLIPISEQYQSSSSYSEERISKRVFFFVFDGATSDDFFSSGAPIIRKKYIETGIGRWGISHTRVPTESRPCHIAMFGGFYEDPSSVTTGWSVNPVSYDSVIQQSQYSLLIGAADVVELFSNMDHVDVFSFPMEMEDFASGNPSSLDEWVEKKFFEKLDDQEIRNKLLTGDQTIVFLQFEGIDAAGHEYRPGSSGYLKTIRNVDKAVERIVRWSEEFFGDDYNSTTFVAATDHGMSKQGTHGGAEYGCTRTPFVVWGAGIPSGNNKNTEKIINDGMFNDDESEIKYMIEKWGMSKPLALKRRDLHQADISPLIASWLGLPIPVNNMGVLPLGYCCSESLEKSVDALLANANQINQQFRSFEEKKKKEISIGFIPFDEEIPFGVDKIMDMEKRRLQQFRKEETIDVEEKIVLLNSFIEWNLRGIRYYQQYHKYFLLCLISMGYICYIIYISFPSRDIFPRPPIFVGILTGFSFSGFCWYLHRQHSPLMTYFYSILPFFFFYCFSYPLFISSKKMLASHSGFFSTLKFYPPKLLFKFIFVEIIVYGFFDRKIFGIGYFLLGLLESSYWCIALGFISLLPLDPVNRIYLIFLGVSLFVVFQKRRVCSEVNKLFLLIGLAFVNVTVNDMLIFLPKQFLSMSIVVKVVSWVLLIISILSPFFFNQSRSMFARFEKMVLSFSVSYILLTVNYEMVFYTCFVNALFEWISKNQEKKRESMLSNNLLYVYFFISSFFATGNLASFSGFQLNSVYRFVTTLRPHLMAGLLVWKLMIPFLLTTSSLVVIFGVEKKKKKGKEDYLVFLESLNEIVSLCDIMSITFLFLVKDKGSWLEIGNSISSLVFGSYPQLGYDSHRNYFYPHSFGSNEWSFNMTGYIDSNIETAVSGKYFVFGFYYDAEGIQSTDSIIGLDLRNGKYFKDDLEDSDYPGILNGILVPEPPYEDYFLYKNLFHDGFQVNKMGTSGEMISEWQNLTDSFERGFGFFVIYGTNLVYIGDKDCNGSVCSSVVSFPWLKKKPDWEVFLPCETGMCTVVMDSNNQLYVMSDKTNNNIWVIDLIDGSFKIIKFLLEHLSGTSRTLSVANKGVMNIYFVKQLKDGDWYVFAISKKTHVIAWKVKLPIPPEKGYNGVDVVISIDGNKILFKFEEGSLGNAVQVYVLEAKNGEILQ